ncbi:MAG: Mut7-C RNAse domain-containing protein [Desulfatiglans sp.]|nr:Mut7-C RNAse domain-containing protein [Thermodesulfobacteriota bacterium]MEE4351591.1 Mut7-C RNAse domain-containing protein [Desulfatiglans sp.]
MKLVVDSMLGKLAKWLRVMGHDTHYQSFYGPGDIELLMKGRSYFLTRNRTRSGHYHHVVLLHSNKVEKQLAELKKNLPIQSPRSNWFTRCLICNTLLEEKKKEEVQENVPEYVFYHNITTIKACHECGRYYWPGSHRSRMLVKLKEWGFGF